MQPPKQPGFSLIELMVTLTIIAILAVVAGPAFAAWLKNGQVRTAGDALQNGLRTAQAEALRRSRLTVFALTDSIAPQTSLTAVANGKSWAVRTIAMQGTTTDTPAFVESGVLGSGNDGVQFAGPAAICFNSLGRLVTNASPDVGGARCEAADIPARYNLSLAGADRSLRVDVAVGGQVRMCDPAKTLTAATPDGCPP